ncbi:LOW QUALITY PROTEIN: hypothetical protein PHMEG_00022132 [Phytophthora megakarya]|uniref:DDE Tnp4 domain-containing protein n=1 Tax=Phytophthora megakarya TaxID=4795 RepID=A0A225VL49_9STRA|nr:LOW QUALITY PROTEIN: hypothetical protein PHMEG_00022132 [Phytophthora megakarya]
MGVFATAGPKPCFGSLTSLLVLWFSVRSHIHRYWNIGHGWRSTFAAKDVLFMMLVVMNAGGTWDKLSRIFRIKTPTFIKTIMGFIEDVAPRWRRNDDESIENVRKRVQELSVHLVRHRRNLPIVQSPSRNNGRSHAVVHLLYSAKRKLFGFKVEVSVNPKGLDNKGTSHARDNTADITMFHTNKEFHDSARKKLDGDQHLSDVCPLATDYPESGLCWQTKVTKVSLCIPVESIRRKEPTSLMTCNYKMLVFPVIVS